jgi:DNA-binding MarR family transcriptional regulator
VDKELKRSLLKTLFRFKKTGYSISNYLINEMQSDLNIAEIFALTCIKEHTEKGCSGKKNECECGKNATTHDAMQSVLSVSKAAVSQTLGELEKKGYVERKIDSDNRRKILITLTDEGRAALENSTVALDKLVVTLINRFGEVKTGKLVSMVNSFAELVEKVIDIPPGFGLS